MRVDRALRRAKLNFGTRCRSRRVRARS